MFFISSLIIYIVHRSSLTVHCSKFKAFSLQLSAFSFYFLALLSKEMAITFPLIIFLYEWLFPLNKPVPEGINRGGGFRGVLFNPYTIGYIAVTIIYLFIRFYLFQNPEEDIHAWSLSERLMTIPYLILKYLLLLIAPISLSADYVITPVQSLVSLKFIIPLIIISLPIILPIVFNLQYSIFNRQSVFGILFLLLTLLPVYNAIPIANPFAERYLYLPMAGFAVAIGLLIARNSWRITYRSSLIAHCSS